MNDKINWGVLGYARIAKTQVIPAILKDPNSVLYGVASRSEESLKECRTNFHPHNTYKSYEELLLDPNIDAVYIPLPNALHHFWSIRACEAGKHVLCEKPLAMNLNQCRQMIQASQANNVTLMEGFMYRYSHKIKEIERILSEGLLGKIRYVFAEWRFYLNRQNTIKEQLHLGGGSLFDVGSYPVNLLSLITNQKADFVQATATVRKGVDMTFAGSIVYPDGLTAQICSGFTTQKRTYAEIAGEKGSLVIPDPFSGEAGEFYLDTEEGRTVVPTRETDRYLSEIKNFTSVLLGKDGRLLSLDDSLRNTELLEKLGNRIKKVSPDSLQG
ncbi:Gfo/Idh/MocA family protein [Spirochaeta cellobiosiphila]|uniref:Gfo/Idh/MocA family protein n=1 Tax=Spirochaeta cellobiosiphila TaxID=504483 RepID=UPI000418EF48|nr:Gfo/Idh/MocA family oxidoreductase [Spirochaeta cellobiosiphila]